MNAKPDPTPAEALAVLRKWYDTEIHRCNHRSLGKCHLCVERNEAIATLARAVEDGETFLAALERISHGYGDKDRRVIEDAGDSGSLSDPEYASALTTKWAHDIAREAIDRARAGK